jgi:hypothetical protein
MLAPRIASGVRVVGKKIGATTEPVSHGQEGLAVWGDVP